LQCSQPRSLATLRWRTKAKRIKKATRAKSIQEKRSTRRTTPPKTGGIHEGKTKIVYLTFSVNSLSSSFTGMQDVRGAPM
jgi:hypothetical protein